jgi:putative endonuclease
VGSIPTGSTMTTKKTGSFGERFAERYLINKGYQILDKNYSAKISGGPLRGEIDIVAKKYDIISFVEVKTLKKRGEPFSAIAPEEKVNFGKQKKLVKTAESWLMKKKIPLDTKWQIDIIAIEINSNKKLEINHFENAVSYIQ